MIRYKDFKIGVTQKGSFFKDAEFETIEETMIKINYWIESNEIKVFNIETIVLPSIHKRKGGTGRPYYKTTYGDASSDKWYQVFRVWYHDGEFPAPPQEKV